MKVKRCILIAEDNECDVLLFKKAALKAKIVDSLYFVGDGQSAMDYLAGRSKYCDRKLYPLPVISILDIKLPKKTGLEALQWIREKSNVKRLPVMILSTSSEECDVRTAYELGANAYLVKPNSLDEFSMGLASLRSFWLDMALLPEDVE